MKAAVLANPTTCNYTILQAWKNAAKEKDWNDFLQEANYKIPLPEIKSVNIICGKKTRKLEHLDATSKAGKLINKWASASSYDELPLQVGRARHKTRETRLGRITSP